MIAEGNKILFILHLPPPVHGAAIMGQNIQKSKLINETFECHYINLSTTKKIENIGKNGVSKILTFLKLYYTIILALSRERYDLCYLTINSKDNGFYKDIVIVFILKCFRQRLVYHYHNKGVSENQNKPIDNLLHRFQFKRSCVILLSPLLYYDISEYVSQRDVYYCANGIENIANSYSIKTESTLKPKLLFLSNVSISKGIFVLLKACRILVDRKIDFELYIVGDWTSKRLKKELAAKCMEYELLNYVYICGKKVGIEKEFYFSKADIFILPTLDDCFPLVLLEAMGRSIPIISTNEGAIPEIVEDSISGYIIPKNDPVVLADKIEHLIKNPNLCIAMGKRGLEKYEKRFTIQKFENNFINTLKKIITDFNSGRKNH